MGLYCFINRITGWMHAGGGLSGYKFNTVALSDTPINLVTLNSAYDDYNSTAPWGGGDYPFCFSSSRNSQGKNFDFIFTYLNVSMSKIDGTSNISASVNTTGDFFTANENVFQALVKINTAADELGPYMVPQATERGRTLPTTNIILTRVMYSCMHLMTKATWISGSRKT